MILYLIIFIAVVSLLYFVSRFWSFRLEFKVYEKVKLPNGQRIAVLGAERFSNSNLIYIVLLKPTIIKTKIGNIKAKGRLHFYINGNIDIIHTAEPFKFNGIGLGNYTNGYVDFFKNGNINSGNMIGSQLINTSAGNLNVKDFISFHNNGVIKLVTLAEDTTIDGKLYDYDAHLGFDEHNVFLGEMACDTIGHWYLLEAK